MKIIHLRNIEIDRARWDCCITESINQLTYAYSWYLDIVSPQWEALISEDYEYVMPLPVKIKYKIPYLVQPMHTQQLGIFSKHKINENLVENFIKEIPYFSYEINLNEHNFHPNALAFPNLILDLVHPYKQIKAGYSKNTQRNIDKAKKLNLKIRTDLTCKVFLDFYYSVEKTYSPVKQTPLEKLIKTGISVNSLTLYGVFSTDNKLIAGLCLLHSSKRLTYLLPISSAEGKASSAMFLLVDYLIHKEAETQKYFDFEGSKIDGIARFYKGFGAKNHSYYVLKRFRPSFIIGK